MSLLKGETAFQKLFLLFRKRYESLGRIGGTVSLKSFSVEELKVISGLTGLPVEELRGKQSITLLRFEKSLNRTRYQYDSLLSFLEDYFEETFVANRDLLMQEQEREMEFLRDARVKFPQIDWYIDWVSSKSADTRWIWSVYKEDSARLSYYLEHLEKAWGFIRKEHMFIRIPLFAQKVTGNPHAFDRNAILGKMLLHLLTVDQKNKEEGEISFSKTSEEENDLLGFYGLLRDDLWSFITCQNILAETDQGLHPVWMAAQETGTVLNLPLKELIKVDKVYPYRGNAVWVVENSSVASTLMDLAPTAPVICTHGQVRIAGWRLIELLASSEVTIYYSGDLDPEGMLIADRLVGRFPEAVQLWRMDEKSYLEGRSEEIISDKRLSQLKKLRHPGLNKVAEGIQREKRAGYQEALVEVMLEDLKRE
ncbi:TIGR02679 domain-containing protein [Bacillus salacetis]|uniref:TIGR02679 domain-containing protein n=1 Tax=Bacillus salacetis TaxID=2315464 RepID=UPI0014444289|nr:TIGR02679 domain-containing protein [Bacillus salacetis]